VGYANSDICSSTDSIDILPVVPLSIDWDINSTDQQVEAINNSVGFTSQSWYINGQLSPVESNRIVFYGNPETDSIDLMLIISNDFCSDTARQTVSLLKASLYFPNVFTPGKELNNRFCAYGTGFVDFELWIYDRQGVLLYHSTNPFDCWDGTHNGTPCPQGTYVYHCRYRNQLMPLADLRSIGTVTLIR
jgi:gliding motility-associated-like protein